jgi:spore germination protein GerM
MRRPQRKTLWILGLVFAALCILIVVLALIPRSIENGAKYTGEMMTVKAFYGNSELDPELDCTKVYAVDKLVPKTEDAIKLTLDELLKGPTYAEKQKGYFTSLNPGILVQGFNVKNGTAYVDFSNKLTEDAPETCRTIAMKAEITETLLQFPTIKNVVISVGGNSSIFSE